jgi:hypothetical protein
MKVWSDGQFFYFFKTSKLSQFQKLGHSLIKLWLGASVAGCLRLAWTSRGTNSNINDVTMTSCVTSARDRHELWNDLLKYCARWVDWRTLQQGKYTNIFIFISYICRFVYDLKHLEIFPLFDCFYWVKVVDFIVLNCWQIYINCHNRSQRSRKVETSSNIHVYNKPEKLDTKGLKIGKF